MHSTYVRNLWTIISTGFQVIYNIYSLGCTIVNGNPLTCPFSMQHHEQINNVDQKENRRKLHWKAKHLNALWCHHYTVMRQRKAFFPLKFIQMPITFICHSSCCSRERLEILWRTIQSFLLSGNTKIEAGNVKSGFAFQMQDLEEDWLEKSKQQPVAIL